MDEVDLDEEIDFDIEIGGDWYTTPISINTILLFFIFLFILSTLQ